MLNLIYILNNSSKKQTNMRLFRVTTKPFLSGPVNHVIKRVSWHTCGITHLTGIEVTDKDCIARGKKISKNEKEAVPFKINNYKDVYEISRNFAFEKFSKGYKLWLDNSEHNIPGISSAYTDPHNRINTSKEVSIFPSKNNIVQRNNYCDN